MLPSGRGIPDMFASIRPTLDLSVLGNTAGIDARP
jgi:hypothetical protein